MRRSTSSHSGLSGILFVLILTLLSLGTARAQLTAFVRPDDAYRARLSVERLFAVAVDSTIAAEEIGNYAVDEFATQLRKLPLGTPVFTSKLRYRIVDVRSIHPSDTVGIVSVVGTGDSVPFVGPLEVDWAFFVRRIDGGEWRVSALRRLSGMETAIDMLRYLDTTAEFPSSLKPRVAREISAPLMSNTQLREHLRANREKFTRLASGFTPKARLYMVARNADQIAQLNNAAINWGSAAQEVPREAIDEFMATATPEQREQMKAQLNALEKLRKVGNDSLARIARRNRVKMDEVRDVLGLMKDLRLVFINAKLPWPDAIQFTVAGKEDNAVGYIYSPRRSLPYISIEEYYYLEEIGDGWWIFRAT